MVFFSLYIGVVKFLFEARESSPNHLDIHNRYKIANASEPSVLCNIDGFVVDTQRRFKAMIFKYNWNFLNIVIQKTQYFICISVFLLCESLNDLKKTN